jgi:putative ABC transport system substrate-binding protein
MNRYRSIKAGIACGALALAEMAGGIVATPAVAAPPVVGVLTPGGSYEPVVEGFREGMAKLGFREGKEISYVVEDSRGDVKSFESRAMKLAESKPDVIFTVATLPSLAVKKATQTIPVVFTVVGDPVQAGVVASFASSQNNFTGVASINAALSAKRLEILKELAPGTKKTLAIVATKESSAQISFKYLADAAEKLGVQIIRREVTGKDEVESLFREKWSALADSVISVPSIFAVSYIAPLIVKTKSERLPLMVYESSHVEKGALASYAGDFRSFGVQAASLVAKILKKAKPADIPVETPERLFLTLNISTAKAIGLKLPRNLMDRADRLMD